MPKSPRSLNTISCYYNLKTPQGKIIKAWIEEQPNYNQSIRELIVMFGQQYNKWREDQPRDKQPRVTLYQRRRLLGLCVRCGQIAVDDHSRCRKCLDKLKRR